MLGVDHLDAAVKAYAKSRDWTERGDAELAAAYSQDRHSLRVIAARLDLTLEAVRQRLIARGVDLRPPGRAKG